MPVFSVFKRKGGKKKSRLRVVERPALVVEELLANSLDAVRDAHPGAGRSGGKKGIRGEKGKGGEESVATTHCLPSSGTLRPV